MIHQYLKECEPEHWAVSNQAGTENVLVQLSDSDQSVRLSLTPEQARAMASELLRFSSK